MSPDSRVNGSKASHSGPQASSSGNPLTSTEMDKYLPDKKARHGNLCSTVNSLTEKIVGRSVSEKKETMADKE